MSAQKYYELCTDLVESRFVCRRYEGGELTGWYEMRGGQAVPDELLPALPFHTDCSPATIAHLASAIVVYSFFRE